MSPPPSLQTIDIEHLSDSVVLFSYNQPHIANAFTIRQYLDLSEALVWARDETAIKVVVQTGKGKHYCAGKVLQPSDEGGPTIEQEIEAGGKLGQVLESFPKILIAAINGASIGWGCTQLYSFDLVYAWGGHAVFQTPFMSLGFVPEGQSSHTFPRNMGRHHANRLLIAGDKITAQEAYVSGLVTQVIEATTPENFLGKVCEIAKRIGGYDGESLRMVKELTGTEEELRIRREHGRREGVALRVRLNNPETKRMIAEFSKQNQNRKNKEKL